MGPKRDKINETKNIIEQNETVVTSLGIFENSHYFIDNLPFIQAQESITVNYLSKRALVCSCTLSRNYRFPYSRLASNQKDMLSITKINDRIIYL
jgi:hypothetical protein